MIMTWPLFTTRHGRLKAEIAKMEERVERERIESVRSEIVLKNKLERANRELSRPPVAGALVWRDENE